MARAEGIAGALAVGVYGRAAEVLALVRGELEDAPPRERLTEVQECALQKALLHAFDGVERELAELLRASWELRASKSVG